MNVTWENLVFILLFIEMQENIQTDFVSRYRACLEEFAEKRSDNYTVTPFPLYFGGQIFIINSKIIIFGLGQSKQFGVKCMISNVTRNGFVELEGIAMYKLLQQLEEILRISFETENIKKKIELDEKIFVKFIRRKGENLAYIHDIARNSRIFLEAGDIKNDAFVFCNEHCY